MINIQTLDDRMFLLDGITHYRKFFSNVKGSLIRVYNTYNPADVLIDYVDFMTISVDGVTFTDIKQLQTALLEVIFNGEVGTGTGINQNNIFVPMFVNYSGDGEESELATAVNSLPAFTIGDKQLALFSGVNPSQPISTAKKIVFVITKVGKGNFGIGGTSLDGSNIKILSVSSPNIYDILPNPKTQIVDLSELNGLTISEKVNQLNPAVTVQNQEDGYVVFKTKFGDTEVNYLFLGSGGTYGAGSSQTTDEDFVLLTGGNQTIGAYVLVDDVQGDLTPDPTGTKIPNITAVINALSSVPAPNLDQVLATGDEAIGKSITIKDQNTSVNNRVFVSPQTILLFNEGKDFLINLSDLGVSSLNMSQGKGLRLKKTGLNFFEYADGGRDSTLVMNDNSMGLSTVRMPLMFDGETKTLATTADILPTPNLQKVLDKGNLAVLDDVSTILLGGDTKKDRVVAFFISNGEEENFKRGFLVIENGKATIGANKTGARADISFDDARVLISEAIGQNRTNVRFKTPLASGVNLFFPAPNTPNIDYTIALTSDLVPYALDSNVLHRSTNESFTGLKRVERTTDFPSSGLLMYNKLSDGKVLEINNLSAGSGQVINNSSGGIGLDIYNENFGAGMRLVNNGGGSGFEFQNNKGGIGLYLLNPDTGRGIYISNSGEGKGIEIFNLDQGTGFEVNNRGDGKGANIKNTSYGQGFYISNDNTGTGEVIDNKSSGVGLFINNSGVGGGIDISNLIGSGIRITNVRSGFGIDIVNSADGSGIRIDNRLSGEGILVLNSGNSTGQRIQNGGTGVGFSVTNFYGGIGMRLVNSSDGRGFYISNNDTGTAIGFDENGNGKTIDISKSINSEATAVIIKQSKGNAFVANTMLDGTGLNFVGQNNGADTFTVDRLGNVVSKGKVKALPATEPDDLVTLSQLESNAPSSPVPMMKSMAIGNYQIPDGTMTAMINMTSPSATVEQSVFLPEIADSIGSVYYITNTTGTVIHIKSKSGNNDIWDGGTLKNDKFTNRFTVFMIINDGTNFKIVKS